MEANPLQRLYVNELKELRSAESQFAKMLPRLTGAATDGELRYVLAHHEKQAQEHVARLDRMLNELDETPKTKKCAGMDGMLQECTELIKNDRDPNGRDAGLIAKAQNVEHYQMAGYGTAKAWAKRLGLDRQSDILGQSLQEEFAIDKMLTRIAENSINVRAAGIDI